MVFKNNLVAVIKHKGKILREDKVFVKLPFGGEYSILIKNLFSRKALVSVYIDGQDVLKGRKLIINPNSEIELERFLEDDLNNCRKFLFIQKTEKIQEHRGDRIDDGVVRIEYQFESQIPNWNWYYPSWTYTYHPPYYTTYPSWGYYGGGTSSGVTYGSATASSNIYSTQTFNVSNSVAPHIPQTDEGITVRGSESVQSFNQGYIGLVDSEKYVITLQLKGYKDSGEMVKESITVKSKKVCSTCGTKNESVSKYCRECGTYLD